MSKLSKILLGIFLAAGLWLPLGYVNAQNLNQACQVDVNSTLCRDHRAAEGAPGGSRGIYGPDGILVAAANLISIIAGIAAVAMIIFGSIKYVTAGGDPQSTSSAQKTIMFAAIGLAVTGAARFLVGALLNRLAS